MHFVPSPAGASDAASHHLHAQWSDWSIQVIRTPPQDQDLLMPAGTLGAGFCSGGDVAWQIDGAPVRRGSISNHDVFVFSHDEFKWLPSGRGHDCILVRPPESWARCASTAKCTGVSALRRAEFQSDPVTHGILGLIRHEVLTGSETGAMYQEALIDLLGLRMVRDYVVKPRLARQRALRLNAEKQQRVLDCMRSSLSDELTIGRLAALVPMSPFYFVRAFKQTFGKSPYQYLTRLRMEHALSLLRMRKMSITEVAASVGYSSTTHFSSQFRRAWGFSPIDAPTARPTRIEKARDAA